MLKKVYCVANEDIYYVDAKVIPVDAEEFEAFPCSCPVCEDGYAMIVGPVWLERNEYFDKNKKR